MLRLFGLSIIAIVLFLGGILFQRSGTIGKVIIPALNTVVHPINYMRGLMSSAERLTIDINYKNYQKLSYNRELAVKRDMLLPEFRDEVPATIRHNGETIKVKLRLKGDMSDHWGDAFKWSFRVRTRGESTLFGMKRFSIQNPATRGFLNEWVFHKLLKREDFIALRYDFVEVVVNGRNHGIYAIEEHFEKRLIENNRRREGPIIRFDNYLFWANKSMPGTAAGNDAFIQAPVDAFQSGKIEESESYRAQFLLAKDLLESFRLGDLTVKQVFDIDKLAMLFAICDLFGYQHATHYGNIRFYYDPVRAMLEPIGYDQHIIRDVSISLLEGEEIELSNRGLDLWVALIFRDREFYSHYIKALEKISKADYLDSFFSEVKPEMEEKLAILHKSFPEYEFHNESILRRNQEYINKTLNPIRGLHAYFDKTDGKNVQLQIANIHSLSLEVLGIVFDNSLDSIDLTAPVSEKTYLLPKEPLAALNFLQLDFQLPTNLTWSDSLLSRLKVVYRVTGADSTRTESVHAWTHRSQSFLDDDFIRQPDNVERFKFIHVDKESGKIFIQPGSWKVTGNLVFPAGYDVICSENTRIDLLKGARILSYSPLTFIGSEQSPIVITSSDSTGQGLVVLKAAMKSTLEWVIFDNLTNPSHSGWELTGAVTFYESEVTFSHCQFSNNRSEDGLNIIRTDFAIDKSIFKSTKSDAFDGDFVTGTISNTSFVNCGNDAIDISGSVLEITNVLIYGAGDKGLSIGENSSAKGSDIEITDAEIAIASKDLSQLVLQSVTLTNCSLGFTVYMKKPEFGPASISITELSMNGVTDSYIVEENSSLFIEGQRMQSNQEAVKDLLYGVKYGKSSKQ